MKLSLLGIKGNPIKAYSAPRGRPAPLALKIDLVDDDEVATLAGGEQCLAVLKADGWGWRLRTFGSTSTNFRRSPAPSFLQLNAHLVERVCAVSDTRIQGGTPWLTFGLRAVPAHWHPKARISLVRLS